MPSFDVVSQVDKHQLSNAIDQAKRELSNRYDLRGTNAAIELEKEFELKVTAANEQGIEQVNAKKVIALQGLGDIFSCRLSKKACPTFFPSSRDSSPP